MKTWKEFFENVSNKWCLAVVVASTGTQTLLKCLEKLHPFIVTILTAWCSYSNSNMLLIRAHFTKNICGIFYDRSRWNYVLSLRRNKNWWYEFQSKVALKILCVDTQINVSNISNAQCCHAPFYCAWYFRMSVSQSFRHNTIGAFLLFMVFMVLF